MTFHRLSLLVVCLAVSGCAGSSSPNSPSSVESAPEFVFRGETVSAIDGSPLGRVMITIGSQTAESDENGSFDVRNLRQGSETVVISGSSIVERQRTITLPAAAASREALIPSSFDLKAFDEMLRGAGRLERWVTAPALVVLAKEMQFDSFATDDQYHATSEQLTDADTALLIEQLTDGLALLTNRTFTAFSSIEVENPASGARIDTLRPGSIVVGRYRGVQSLANTIGFGRWAHNAAAEVVGGAIYLDRNYDKSSEGRRLLRIHELGHALGYRHVTTRTSIMNPAIGPQPTEFDRQAAAIAFQRAPGNQSPDSDITAAPRPGNGGIFGIRGLSRVTWSPPIICGP